jgi:hypothetical protein
LRSTWPELSGNEADEADMSDENLARQAELALHRQGDHESLFYEGRWHSSGSMAGRAARFATGLASLGVRPGGRSKGVPLTHANLFWCGSAVSQDWERAGVNSSLLPLPLGSYKYPRQVTIVPAVPLTSVGKLDRKKLRQWVAAGAGSG